MKVRDLIEELERMDPDMLVLSGRWDSSRSEYIHLHQMDTIAHNTRVVRKLSEDHFRDVDNGGGTDADHPEVLIL